MKKKKKNNKNKKTTNKNKNNNKNKTTKKSKRQKNFSESSPLPHSVSLDPLLRPSHKIKAYPLPGNAMAIYNYRVLFTRNN